MRALVCRTLSEELSGVSVEEIPAPEAGDGQVLVRVSAAGLNFPDLLMCQGGYQLKPDMPFVPGMDLAGDVAAVGAGVSGLEVGQRVAGTVRFGALAEYAAADPATLRPAPVSLSDAEASAFPIAYLTAWVALVRRAQIQAGETLLVHGASGGVGQATVDLGRALGARVIATTGSPAKAEAIRSFGADEVIVATDGGFRDRVQEFTHGRGADVIFDPVGGDVFDESTRCIAFDGRLLVIGFTSGRFAQLATNLALIKGFSVMGVRAGEYGRRFPARGQENLDAIWQLAADGKVRPHVHEVFPLVRALEAFHRLRSRDVIGKLVVSVRD